MTERTQSGPDEFNIVAESGFRALRGPAFIIRDGGTYYVTAAVLEFDPDRIRTPEQREGVDRVARLFEDGHEKMPAVKVEVPRVLQTCQATRPPDQN